LIEYSFFQPNTPWERVGTAQQHALALVLSVINRAVALAVREV
jgi:hypothetical protein